MYWFTLVFRGETPPPKNPRKKGTTCANMYIYIYMCVYIYLCIEQIIHLFIYLIIHLFIHLFFLIDLFI